MKNITLNTFVSDLRLEPQEINFLHKLDIFKVYEFLLLNNLSLELTKLNVSFSVVASLVEHQNTTLKLIETDSTPTVISDKHLKIWNYILTKFSTDTKGALEKLSIDSLAELVSFDLNGSAVTQKITKGSVLEIKSVQDKLKRMNLLTELQPKKKVEEMKIAAEQKTVKANKLPEKLFEIYDDVMLELVKDELEDKGHGLDRLKVKTYEQLKALSENELSRMFGDIMEIHIQNAISVVEDKIIRVSKKREYKTVKDFPIWTGVPIFKKDVPAKFKPDVNVFDVVHDVRCVKVLKSLDLNTIGDLLLTSYVKVLSIPRIGQNTLNKLRKDIERFIKYEPVGPENLNFGESFSDFISMLCEVTEVSQEHTKIFFGLLCGDNEKPFSRSKMSAKCGCSGERIRQILKLIVDEIKFNYRTKEHINRLNSVLLETLIAAGGIIDVDELSFRISSTMKWNTYPKGYMLGVYVKSFSIDSRVAVLGDNICMPSPYRAKKEITDKLKELVDLKAGKASLSYLADALKTFSKSLHVEGNSCCEEVNFSRALIIEYARKLKLKYDSDNVYGAWGTKAGGLAKKVQAVLASTLEIMTPIEVCDVLNKKLNANYSELQINKALDHAEQSVLWARKKYLHSSMATCSDETLGKISSILAERVANEPFVTLESIYNKFIDIFIKDNIPNKYALGAIISLRMPEYYIEKYRYVYPNKPESSTSVDSILEEWIASFSKPVRYDEAKTFMAEKIGIQKELLCQHLHRLPVIIPTESGYLIHLDHINVKKDNLLKLQDYIAEELKSFDQIGINKVFDKHKKYLAKYKISDSRMLYGILKNYFSDLYNIQTFPHIKAIDKGKGLSLQEILYQFILTQKDIVSISDCEKHFKQIGYRPVQLKVRIATMPSIVQYSKNNFVHKNIIGWTDSKMSSLFELLKNAYLKSISKGRLFGDLKEFLTLKKKQLPVLDNDIEWTKELLYSMVLQMPEVSVIGNAKRAYIMIEILSNNILSLDDLICYVLKNYFDGRCSREDLSQWMKDNGVIIKNLTNKMIPPSENFIFNENEVILNNVD
jgi:hypothetical protein